jgi:hypothetical protein
VKSSLGARLAKLRVCVGDACRQGPDLRLRVQYQSGGGRCVRSNVRLRVGGSAASRITSVVFYRGKALIKRDARVPFTARIRRDRLAQRPTLVRALVTLNDSRSASLDHSLRRCG